MIIKTLKVENELGIHARVAGKIVKCTKSYEAEAYIIKEDKKVNLKSMLPVMMLQAVCGDEVTLCFVGEDEEEVAREMQALFEDKFGEK